MHKIQPRKIQLVSVKYYEFFKGTYQAIYFSYSIKKKSESKDRVFNTFVEKDLRHNT